MNELECKSENCEVVVTVESEVSAVTCSLCCATIGVKEEQMYCLVLKSSDEVIDRTSAGSIKEARLFFIERKRMKPKAFDSLYVVKKDQNFRSSGGRATPF